MSSCSRPRYSDNTGFKRDRVLSSSSRTIRVQGKASNNREREDLAVTLRIVDEVLFTLIRLEAWRRHGFRQLSELRDYVRRHGLEEFYDAINDFEEFVRKLEIRVLEDRGDFIEVLETMRRYNLFPGDALIAAAAKHYGIDTILTFDEDFKRVPWLRVIP